MKKSTAILLWALALIITFSSAVYQRLTGPTHPVRGTVEIAGSTAKYKLLRSHDTGEDAIIRIIAPDRSITGEYIYKRFRSHDEWQTLPLQREGDDLLAAIPTQPAAGKVMYQISLAGGDDSIQKLTDDPVIIRFKGIVPAYILLPHILFMFTAMLVSNRSGLQALAGGPCLYRYALWTSGLLLAGGLILGPVVQKFAFDAYWTGWPWGHDLTDNKTIAAFIFWVVAIVKNRKKADAKWVLIASIVLLLVYLIPHSVLGSELDYTALEQ